MHKNRPVWFGSYNIAASHNIGSVFHTYKTNRDLNLILFSKANILKLYQSIEKSLSDQDKKLFQKVCFFNLDKFQQKIFKNFKKKYPSYTEIFNFWGFFPQNKQEYYSLLFAKLLCSFGFDGWYIQPQKIVQRARLFGTGKPGRFEEILICVSEKVLNKN